jgi:hypothetical protein
MKTRKLSSSNFINILIDCCFEHEDFWFFGVYDRKNHIIFFTAKRQYLQIDEPKQKLHQEHEELLKRHENKDENLILFPILSKDERSNFFRTFIETVEDNKLKMVLESKSELALNNWRPYSLDNLIFETLPIDTGIAEKWQKYKQNIAEPLINKWVEKHKISTEGIIEYLF